MERSIVYTAPKRRLLPTPDLERPSKAPRLEQESAAGCTRAPPLRRPTPTRSQGVGVAADTIPDRTYDNSHEGQRGRQLSQAQIEHELVLRGLAAGLYIRQIIRMMLQGTANDRQREIYSAWRHGHEDQIRASSAESQHEAGSLPRRTENRLLPLRHSQPRTGPEQAPAQPCITNLSFADVAQSIIERNAELRDLTQHIANKTITPAQERTYTNHLRDIRELLAVLKTSRSLPSASTVLTPRNNTLSRSEAVEPPILHQPRTGRDTAASSNTTRGQEDEKSDSLVASRLAAKAASDPKLMNLMRRVAAGKATQDEVRAFQDHMDDVVPSSPKIACTTKKNAETPSERRYDFPSLALEHSQVSSYVSPYAQSRDTSSRAQRPSNVQMVARIPPRPPQAASTLHPPQAHHAIHPDSGVGAFFHSVKYPLSLLPKSSWHALHNTLPIGAVCSSCRQLRTLSVQQRKLFLVAERLSWENDTVSIANRDRNEEALWAVNAELDLFEPAVEDERIVLGGRQSLQNVWFPFQDESEAEGIMMIVAKADVLSQASWKLWSLALESESTHLDTNERHSTPPGSIAPAARRVLGEVSPNTRWLPSTDLKTTVKGKRRAIIESMDLTDMLPTPPSSTEAEAVIDHHVQRSDIRTLQDFYSILDRLERTSPMGARFLEAYAERLRDEACKGCWLKHVVLEDEELEDPARLESRPSWEKVKQG